MSSKFALVIANTKYQDANFAQLTAPGRDAEEFAQVLRELAAFDVQVLLNEGEGKTRRSIARFFANRKRDDLLLLYFSGHGVRNEQGQLFLATNDTEINILEASGIPSEFITYAMNNSRSQRQLLILDCCNSGAFAYGTKSGNMVGQSMGIASAFEGSGFGHVVLTATDATQYAWEGDKVIGDTQKSVFTHFLIEGLRGDADRNGDGRIDVDELYDYAYEEVVRRTPKQTPRKWSYKQQGEIVLRENLRPRELALPADLVEMLSHPNSGVRKAAVQDLITLLEGKHPGLTRAAEEKLRLIAENDDSLTLRKNASEALRNHGLEIEQPLQVSFTAPLNGLPATNPSPASMLEKLQNQAIQYELKGDFGHALQTYYRIKRLEPAFPRVDLKISELEKKVRSKPIGNMRKQEKMHVQSKPVPSIKLITWRPFASVVGAVLFLILLIWGGSIYLANLPHSTPEPTRPIQTNLEFATQLSTTFTPRLEQTDTPASETSITATPSLGIGSTRLGKDGMTLLYVPAGEFIMGMKAEDSLAECQEFSSDCTLEEFKTEAPPHTMNLDAFWIDSTEVTNSMYARCERDRACGKPQPGGSQTNKNYYGNPEFDNYPVIRVLWADADAYCKWAGRRLPTEAEWEKAARGPNGNIYPWGKDFDGELVNFCDMNCKDKELANNLFNDGYEDVSPVGSYPVGKSYYGALDMAGNAWEWVEDWFDVYPGGERISPDYGEIKKVLRGGAFYTRSIIVRGANRFSWYPWETQDSFGFRCAMSATP